MCALQLLPWWSLFIDPGQSWLALNSGFMSPTSATFKLGYGCFGGGGELDPQYPGLM